MDNTVDTSLTSSSIMAVLQDSKCRLQKDQISDDNHTNYRMISVYLVQSHRERETATKASYGDTESEELQGCVNVGDCFGVWEDAD